MKPNPFQKAATAPQSRTTPVEDEDGFSGLGGFPLQQGSFGSSQQGGFGSSQQGTFGGFGGGFGGSFSGGFGSSQQGSIPLNFNAIQDDDVIDSSNIIHKKQVVISEELESKIEKVCDMYTNDKVIEKKYLNIIQILINENKELRTKNKELKTKVELLEKDGEPDNKKCKN